MEVGISSCPVALFLEAVLGGFEKPNRTKKVFKMLINFHYIVRFFVPRFSQHVNLCLVAVAEQIRGPSVVVGFERWNFCLKTETVCRCMVHFFNVLKAGSSVK
jgi:hypothetical protein